MESHIEPGSVQTRLVTSATTSSSLLEAFRSRYYNFKLRVQTTLHESFGDTTVIERLGDDLDEFSRAFQQVS